MPKRVSAKLILYSFLVFLFLWGCAPEGGGDSYRSEVYDSTSPAIKGGIEVSTDRKKIRIYALLSCFSSPQNLSGQWMDIGSGGTSEFTYRCGGSATTYGLEIANGQVRIYQNSSFSNWAPLCPQGGGSSTLSNAYKVDTSSDNKIRFCYRSYWSGRWVCGNWVSYECPISCPSGYTYNPSRDICEADPIYNYSCPSGDYQCVEDSPGVAYCSPYDCGQRLNGTPYCMTGPISSSINANVIGLWWCSGDGTWLRNESECIENCPYYRCKMDGQVYTGADTCAVSCREVYSCEVF